MHASKNILCISILRVALVSLAVFSSVICLEIFLRVSVAVQNNYAHSESFLTENAQRTEVMQRITTDSPPPTTFNIYYFGESTMQGIPFQNTLPILIERMFHSQINGKKIVSENMAYAGIDIDEVVERLRWVIDTKDTKTFPSLLVVYAGHNEFLKYQNVWGFTASPVYSGFIQALISQSVLARRLAELLHLYTLEVDNRSYMDVPVCSAKTYEETIEHYTEKIQEIMAIADAHHVPLIISTVAGNYADFEPNRSVFCPQVQASQFIEYMDKGNHAASRYDYDDALESYKNALRICNTFAETNFRIGKIYETKGDSVNAQEFYERAVDTDQMPIRATSMQNTAIRALAQSKIRGIVDPIQELKKQSENGTIGYNFMIDGHHPNIHGYTIIGTVIAQKIFEMFPEQTSFSPISHADAYQLFLGTTDQKYWELQNEAEWLVRLSTWTYDPTLRLKKADEYLHQAIYLVPDRADAYLDMSVLYLIKKETELASLYYKKALSLDPERTKNFMNNPWIYQLKLRAGMRL